MLFAYSCCGWAAHAVKILWLCSKPARAGVLTRSHKPCANVQKLLGGERKKEKKGHKANSCLAAASGRAEFAPSKEHVGSTRSYARFVVSQLGLSCRVQGRTAATMSCLHPHPITGIAEVSPVGAV